MDIYQSLKPAYALSSFELTHGMVDLVRANLIVVISGDTPAFRAQKDHDDPLQFLAVSFYGRLFEIAPDVRTLFKRPITEQGSMLVKMISLSVQLLDDLDTLIPTLQRLAARHVRYGAKIEHYGAVGEALMWALGRVSGGNFTPATSTAWLTVYSLMLSVMIPAQYKADQALAAKKLLQEEQLQEQQHQQLQLSVQPFESG